MATARVASTGAVRTLPHPLCATPTASSPSWENVLAVVVASGLVAGRLGPPWPSPRPPAGCRNRRVAASTVYRRIICFGSAGSPPVASAVVGSGMSPKTADGRGARRPSPPVGRRTGGLVFAGSLRPPLAPAPMAAHRRRRRGPLLLQWGLGVTSVSSTAHLRRRAAGCHLLATRPCSPEVAHSRRPLRPCPMERWTRRRHASSSRCWN